MPFGSDPFFSDTSAKVYVAGHRGMVGSAVVRALEAGASARKALAHTNRVMHKKLPGGVCAKASLLELAPSEVKLYQAGFRAPLWICQAGEVLEISA